jgi:signal transduction histidine kinase
MCDLEPVNTQPELASLFSHEFRTHLSSLHVAMTLLRDEAIQDLSPSAQELLEIAYRNSERLLQLLNRFLDLKQTQAQQLTFHFEPVELK